MLTIGWYTNQMGFLYCYTSMFANLHGQHEGFLLNVSAKSPAASGCTFR